MLVDIKFHTEFHQIKGLLCKKVWYLMNHDKRILCTKDLQYGWGYSWISSWTVRQLFFHEAKEMRKQKMNADLS